MKKFQDRIRFGKTATLNWQKIRRRMEYLF